MILVAISQYYAVWLEGEKKNQDRFWEEGDDVGQMVGDKA
jgi:hypothetical protein